MSRSMVRSEDVRGLWRLIGETKEIKTGRAAQQAHVVDRLTELLHAQVCALISAGVHPPVGGESVVVHDRGWGTASDRAAVWTTFGHMGQNYDPAVGALNRLCDGTKQGHGVVRRRMELVSDRAWYGAPMVFDVYRRCRVDDSIYGSFPSTTPGRIYGIGIKRAWGDRAFLQEDANLVELFMIECDWLWKPSPSDIAASLPPRQRATLQHLLDGASLKQIAHELGISRYTVNDYVKAIYTAFGVHSRGELLARFIERRS